LAELYKNYKTKANIANCHNK